MTTVHKKAVVTHRYRGRTRSAVGVKDTEYDYPTAILKIGRYEVEQEVLVAIGRNSTLLGKDLPFFDQLLGETADTTKTL